MTTNDTAIHTRALLVWLQISMWSARKYDKSVTNKVNRDAGASSDAGRYNKFLLPGDATSYKTLVTMLGALRAWHYSQTLAWSDEGNRLLTTANFTSYADTLRQKIAEIDRATDTFVADYPVMRLNAQRHLNGLYKLEDYPDVSDIRSKFAVNVSYNSVPMQGDVRVNLADDQIAMIEANIAANKLSAVETAMRDTWSRLHAVVHTVVKRLSEPDPIFRDTLIDNVRECCEVLGRLNVTNDSNLDTMRDDVMRQIASMTPQTLRDSKVARQQTADKAKAILDKMAAFYSVPTSTAKPRSTADQQIEKDSTTCIEVLERLSA